MDNEHNFEKADKIAGYMQGSVDPEDFSKWVEKEEKNKKLFDSLASPDTLDKKFSQEQLSKDKKNTASSWKKIEGRIAAEKFRRRMKWRYIAAAASACLLVGFSTFFLTKYIDQKQLLASESKISFEENREVVSVSNPFEMIDLEYPQDVLHLEKDLPMLPARKDIVDYSAIDMGLGKEKMIYNRIEVPRGGEFKFRLCDGTIVHLNAGSSLKFPVNFISKTRTVELTGEAYFEVTPDKKPFIVNTNYGDVRVLGTKFNVKAYPKDYFMEVSLLEGSVQLFTYGNAPVLLEPSQQVLFDENTRKLTVKTGDAALNAAWKDGKIIFKDRKLEYIMTDLARWYDMKVTMESDVLKEMRFGCKLNKYKTIEPIFELLESTGKIKVEVTGNHIHLREIR